MNLLEHYILEVLKEKTTPQYPSLVTAEVLVTCCGGISKMYHTTTKVAWEEEKKKGYFRA